MTKEVHIIEQDGAWCLRTGLFHSFVGWQTAEGAKLPVKTRDEAGQPIVRCLDNLPRDVAEKYAAKLGAYILANTPENQARKIGKRMQERAEFVEKYEEAMRDE